MRLDRHAAGRRLDKGKHFTAAGIDVEHPGRRAARCDREVEIAPREISEVVRPARNEKSQPDRAAVRASSMSESNLAAAGSVGMLVVIYLSYSGFLRAVNSRYSQSSTVAASCAIAGSVRERMHFLDED
jgi:hypothetical protein